MIASEIETYQDLIKFLKLEVHKQTKESRIVRIRLSEKLFLMMVKFVQFYLRHDVNEKAARIKIDNTADRFEVRINGYLTKVEKK